MRKFGANNAKLVLFHRCGNYTATFNGIRPMPIAKIGWTFVRIGFNIMYKHIESCYDQRLDKV